MSDKKFALNFICKNESHIVTRMLDSVRPITDLIVASDTGSTDNTIAIIKAYGKQYGIPTYVFERPFDNFDTARNFALEKLYDTVHDLGWPPENTWGFWIDCDEIMQFLPGFSRNDISMELYYIKSLDGNNVYNKQCFFSLNRRFYWIGPIHEYMKCDEEVSKDGIATVQIIYEREGASWKGDLEKKFLNYAVKLRGYVNEGNRVHRWIWYEGSSYQLAAEACPDTSRKRAHHEAALAAFDELKTLKDTRRNRLFRAEMAIAASKHALGAPWYEEKSFYLQAYEADSRCADAFFAMSCHYFDEKKFGIANIYSELAFDKYHGKIPTDKDITELNSSLYRWGIIFQHYLILLERDTAAARRLYPQLKQLSANKSLGLSDEELKELFVNAPWVRTAQKRVHRIKSVVRNIFNPQKS